MTLTGTLLLAPLPRLFDNGTLLSKAAILQPRIPAPYVVVNPDDAAKLNLMGSERAVLRTDRETAEVEVRISPDAPVGVMLLAENLGVKGRGGLLDRTGQPTSATLTPVPEMAIGD